MCNVGIEMVKRPLSQVSSPLLLGRRRKQSLVVVNTKGCCATRQLLLCDVSAVCRRITMMTLRMKMRRRQGPRHRDRSVADCSHVRLMYVDYWLAAVTHSLPSNYVASVCHVGTHRCSIANSKRLVRGRHVAPLIQPCKKVRFIAFFSFVSQTCFM